MFTDLCSIQSALNFSILYFCVVIFAYLLMFIFTLAQGMRDGRGWCGLSHFTSTNCHEHA